MQFLCSASQRCASGRNFAQSSQGTKRLEALEMHDRLAEQAMGILRIPEPAEKSRLTRALAAGWREGRFGEIGEEAPPDRPARPDRPLLLLPRDMPKRRAGGSRAGRIALLHALAHIELNAIDLACD